MIRRKTRLPPDVKMYVRRILRANTPLFEFFRFMVNNGTDLNHRKDKNSKTFHTFSKIFYLENEIKFCLKWLTPKRLPIYTTIIKRTDLYVYVCVIVYVCNVQS